VGRGDVQRRQGRRSRQAILRVVSASRAVRRRDVSAELCLYYTRTRKVKHPPFVSPLRSVPFNLRLSVFSWDSEFVKVVEVLSQCRGKTKFEQFKRGLARNDMVRAIQRCDRQMIRMFDRFMVSEYFPPLRVRWYERHGMFSWQAAMVVDIRFQQLFAERAQSTPIQMAMPLPMATPAPMRSLSTPTSMPIPVLTSTMPPVNVEEPQPIHHHPLPYPQSPIAKPSTLWPPSSHVRQPSASSSTTLFVISSPFSLLF
jgi:hypothetical protein